MCRGKGREEETEKRREGERRRGKRGKREVQFRKSAAFIRRSLIWWQTTRSDFKHFSVQSCEGV